MAPVNFNNYDVSSQGGAGFDIKDRRFLKEQGASRKQINQIRDNYYNSGGQRTNAQNEQRRIKGMGPIDSSQDISNFDIGNKYGIQDVKALRKAGYDDQQIAEDFAQRGGKMNKLTRRAFKQGGVLDAAQSGIKSRRAEAKERAQNFTDNSNSNNTTDSFNTQDSFNTEGFNTTDSFNSQIDSNDNNSTNDSFNTQDSNNVSGFNTSNSGNTTNKDSFNTRADANDNRRYNDSFNETTRDSFNTDASTNDSFNTTTRDSNNTTDSYNRTDNSRANSGENNRGIQGNMNTQQNSNQGVIGNGTLNRDAYNNNRGVIGDGKQYNTSGNVSGTRNMGGIGNTNTDNSFNAQNISNQIGKQGDMNFTAGDGNTFYGSNNNDYSITFGQANQGNGSGGGGSFMSGAQAATAANALNDNFLMRGKAMNPTAGMAAQTIQQATMAAQMPNFNMNQAFMNSGASQNYLMDLSKQYQEGYQGNTMGYQAPGFTFPGPFERPDLDPAKDIYEETLSKLK